MNLNEFKNNLYRHLIHNFGAKYYFTTVSNHPIIRFYYNDNIVLNNPLGHIRIEEHFVDNRNYFIVKLRINGQEEFEPIWIDINEIDDGNLPLIWPVY